MYHDLREDFERLRYAGVKFDSSMLRLHAQTLIDNVPSDSNYFRTNQSMGKPIRDCITTLRIQQFMCVQKIVRRSQTEKLMVSPDKQLEIEKRVAYHLGCLKRAFESGELNEDTVENADETHFVFNLDNGKTRGFIGDNHVKYADVVSGGEPITMMLRITGGRRALMQPPMLIFKNNSRSHPIRGVPDDVPEVSYRSSPKGWMDAHTWKEWLTEPRVIPIQSGETWRTLFVDNCVSHVEDEIGSGHLKKLKTLLRKLVPAATDLVQA